MTWLLYRWVNWRLAQSILFFDASISDLSLASLCLPAFQDRPTTYTLMASIEEEWTQLRDAVSGMVAQKKFDDATMYAKSFLARKKITLGSKGVSTLAFKFSSFLSDHSAGAPAAGTFLEWFIDEGSFHVETKHAKESVLFKWCDLETTTTLLEEMPVDRRQSIVAKIYSPLHKSLAKRRITTPQQQQTINSSLHERLDKLEQTFANLFEESEDWLHAFEAVLRFKVPDIARAARILDKLSDESKSEKPLFFGRAVLKLMAQGHADKAATMLGASAAYVDRTTASGSSLAVLALAAALTPLAGAVAAAPEQRPSAQQQEAFVALATPARAMLQRVDLKLVRARPPMCRTQPLLPYSPHATHAARVSPTNATLYRSPPGRASRDHRHGRLRGGQNQLGGRPASAAPQRRHGVGIDLRAERARRRPRARGDVRGVPATVFPRHGVRRRAGTLVWRGAHSPHAPEAPRHPWHGGKRQRRRQQGPTPGGSERLHHPWTARHIACS